jgi:hypothetical protein
MSPRRPGSIRAIAMGFLALVVVGVGLAISIVGFLRQANRRSVQQLAAPHLSCPPKDIRVSEEQMGVEDSYRVEGCGKRGRVRCAPQDPKCSFEAE